MMPPAAQPSRPNRIRGLLACLLLGIVIFPLAAAVPSVPLANGSVHSLMVQADGTLWAVGDNSYGQLGDGTRIKRSTPVHITDDVAAVAAGYVHSFFIKTDGTLWAMGSNWAGQFGDGSTITRTSPVHVASNVTAVATGMHHSLFIKTDGTLWAMGNNSHGQLGDGSTIARTTPVPIASNVTAVAAGIYQSAFVKADGTLWTMGWNGNGQLGDGSAESRATPVMVASEVSKVAAGYAHTAFIKTDSTLWAMGYNGGGQLGDGTLIGRLLPVQVATDVIAVGAGSIHTLAVKTDGSLWTVGYSSEGQLGTGNYLSQRYFVQVATGVSAVGTGPYHWHSLFLAADGGIYGMGSNQFNQVSPGAAAVATPVLILAAPIGTPEFTLQPIAQTVVGGESAAFTITTDGDPAPALQWQRLAAGETTWANLSDDDTYTGTTTATLVIEPALPAMSGDAFRCVATNAGSSAQSAEVTLTVLHPLPAPTIAPAPGVIPTGQLVTLAIEADDTTLHYTVDGSEPTAASPLYSEPFAVSPPLTLRVRGFKSGLPPSPITEAAYELLLPPEISFQPESQSFSRGATVPLTVIATGGNLAYQWYEGASGDTTHPVADATTASLTTPELLESAQYWVRITNAAGQVDSATAALTLHLLPLDNWTANPIPVLNSIVGLAKGGIGVPPVVIAVGSGSPEIVFEIGPSNLAEPGFWTQRINNSGWNLSAVIWTGSTFVAAGRNGQWHVSSNAIHWTRYSTGTGSFVSINDIAWNGSAYVAVGDQGGVARTTNITNANGWTDQSVSGAHWLYGIIWSGSQFVAVGSSSSSGIVYTSPDGITWTRRTAGITSSGLRGLVYGGGQYVAVGVNGTVLTSPDAITWTARTTGVSTELKKIAWSGLNYVAVGNAGTIITSPNGVDWTTRYSGVTTNLLSILWEPQYSNFIIGGSYILEGSLSTILVAKDDPSGPPAIIAHPQPATIGLGQTAALSINATGDNRTYQWYQGISGDTRTPLAGKTAASLTTPALTEDTVFWVRVTNDAGFVNSDAALVTVVLPPVITTTPQSYSVGVGATVQLTGAASGTGPITYQWQHLSAGSETWADVASATPFSGVTTTTLAISPVAAALSGDSFRLAATNLGGTTYSAAAIVVASQPPAITQHPASLNANALTPFVFTAAAEGYPAPDYRWEFRENSTASWTTLTDASDITGATSHQLTFTSPSAALSGSEVRFIASSGLGTASSDPATLTITKRYQSITFGALSEQALTEVSFTLNASASSGLAITYTSSNSAVATVSGDLVTLHGPGTTNLIAYQAGNIDWLAATPMQQELTVTAGAAPDSFASWAEGLGLTGDDALPEATPFPDGLANLVRYAMNLDANPAPAHLPTVATTQIEGAPHLIMEYRQRKALDGITVTPQWSENLTTWSDVPGDMITPLADDDVDTARYRATKPFGTGGQIFMRVCVTMTP